MMMLLLGGLLAGLLHVFSGADHLAAIAPFAVRSPGEARWIGWKWGLGHGCGVLLVGGLALLARGWFSLEEFSSWSERGVGVLLVVIGGLGLRRAWSAHLHVHEHRHAGEVHAHFHLHRPGQDHGPSAHHHRHAPLGIGALHGFAGASHVYGVLPALAIPSLFGASIYLVSYAAGTAGGMAGFSDLIGRLTTRFSIGRVGAYRWMLGSSSLAALVVGGCWLLL